MPACDEDFPWECKSTLCFHQVFCQEKNVNWTKWCAQWCKWFTSGARSLSCYGPLVNCHWPLSLHSDNFIDFFFFFGNQNSIQDLVVMSFWSPLSQNILSPCLLWYWYLGRNQASPNPQRICLIVFFMLRFRITFFFLAKKLQKLSPQCITEALRVSVFHNCG